MGVFLLITLTITVCPFPSEVLWLESLSGFLGSGQVDWTIRLIVINSKLSGANSFQATVEACFGKSGLIAISVSLDSNCYYDVVESWF
jgi:hypothetical protein